LTYSLTTLYSVARDLVFLLVLPSRSRRALAAENLFLSTLLSATPRRGVINPSEASHPPLEAEGPKPKAEPLTPPNPFI
jgi:hypothetical protein